MQDKFVSITTNIIQEVSRPVGDDMTRNLCIWLDSECSGCEVRRKASGLRRRLEAVNWTDITDKNKCANVVSDNII